MLIVSHEGKPLHFDVVPVTEDTDLILSSPEQRPMPYGQYRTSIGDIRPIKRVATQELKNTLGNLPLLPQSLQLKQSQDTVPTKELE